MLFNSISHFLEEKNILTTVTVIGRQATRDRNNVFLVLKQTWDNWTIRQEKPLQNAALKSDPGYRPKCYVKIPT